MKSGALLSVAFMGELLHPAVVLHTDRQPWLWEGSLDRDAAVSTADTASRAKAPSHKDGPQPYTTTILPGLISARSAPKYPVGKISERRGRAYLYHN